MNEVRSALVIGGTGFVGQALTRRLAEDKVATHSLMFRDRPRRITPGGELIECETNSADAIARALDGHRFDAVFHLAAAGVMPDRRDPQTLLAGNVALVSNVLEADEERSAGDVHLRGKLRGIQHSHRAKADHGRSSHAPDRFVWSGKSVRHRSGLQLSRTLFKFRSPRFVCSISLGREKHRHD